MNDSRDDILISEEEGDPEFSSSDDPSEYIKKIKTERDLARKEANEYLSGWQRSKADYVNLQRRTREIESEIKKKSLVAFGKNLIPVYDSIEAGMKSKKNAFMGLESLIQQLDTALSSLGIERFTPREGEVFDPIIHEPMQTVATEKELDDNKIAETLQSGYRVEETILRPARVLVFKHITNN